MSSSADICEAVAKGDVQSVVQLIEAGEDVNKVQDLGIYCNTPLHLASQLNSSENVSRDIIHILISHGADANKENRFQQTPLHLACQHGNLYLATVLVDEQHAALDQPDCGGLTPLMHAVYRGRVELVDFLLKRGCDLEILDNEASSALDMAILNQHQDIISLLLIAGCELEKAKGHVYCRSHYVNSYVYTLINLQDVRNVKLLHDSGCSSKEYLLPGLIAENNISSEIDMPVEMRETLKNIVFEPRTLKNACRRAVRRCVARFKKRNEYLGSKLQRLGLPTSLVCYLALDEYRDLLSLT